MFVRKTTFTGLEDVDAAVAFLRDTAIAERRHQRGARGLMASGNRLDGELEVMGYWDTDADLEASQVAVSAIRQEARRGVGGQVSTETMEEVFSESVGPESVVGRSAVFVQIDFDPAKIDAVLGFLQSEVVPELTASTGFVAMHGLIDRRAGRGCMVSIWADDQALHAACEITDDRRRRGPIHGVSFGNHAYRTVMLSHLE